MKRNTTITFLALYSAIFSVDANAAGYGPVATISGYLLAAILAGGLFYLRANTRRSEVRAEDLAKRLTQSEKTVAQLQTARAKLIEKNDAAKAEMLAVEVRRQETADMLATLRTQVERVARVDGLTGVANRQQFDISLVDEIKRCIRERKDVSLLLIEVDTFHEFRDIAGEQKAEYVLQRVANAISESFRRAGDLVARVGEFKFGVLLPGTDQATAAKFAEKMRRAVYGEALPYQASEIADRITVSVGLVTLPPIRLHKADNAIAMAENALRDAQNNGYNQISVGMAAA